MEPRSFLPSADWRGGSQHVAAGLFLPVPKMQLLPKMPKTHFLRETFFHTSCTCCGLVSPATSILIPPNNPWIGGRTLCLVALGTADGNAAEQRCRRVPNPHQPPRCAKKSPTCASILLRNKIGAIEKTEGSKHLVGTHGKRASLGLLGSWTEDAVTVTWKLMILHLGSKSWCWVTCAVHFIWQMRCHKCNAAMRLFPYPLGKKNDHWEASWTLERKFHQSSRWFGDSNLPQAVAFGLQQAACLWAPAKVVWLKNVVSERNSKIAQVHHYICVR